MTMLNYSKKIQRTKIWPLRWIGNICSEIATSHLIKAINLEEELDSNLGFLYKYHAKMWVMFNQPYKRWGTVYTIDIEAWKKKLDETKLDMSGDGWDDYDEFGKAYWENFANPEKTISDWVAVQLVRRVPMKVLSLLALNSRLSMLTSPGRGYSSR